MLYSKINVYFVITLYPLLTGKSLFGSVPLSYGGFGPTLAGQVEL